MRKTVIGGVQAPFYQDTKYSTWVMATGDTGFRPFAAVEAENLRNYVIGQNLFTQNQGRVLLLKASIHDTAYANLQMIEAVVDAFNKVIEQGRIEIQQDSRIVHRSLLSEICQPLSNIFTGGSGATETRFPALRIDGGPNKTAKPGVYFEPPLVVGNGRQISFAVTLPSGLSVPADLNTKIMKFELVTEELPQENITPVRA